MTPNTEHAVLIHRLFEIGTIRFGEFTLKSGIKSPYQARQLVSHRHVSIGNRKVNIPGYLVRTEEEPQILLHIEVPSAVGAQPAS